MPKRKFYAVYDDGERIGMHTAEEAEKELGIPKKHVYPYAKNNWNYKGRYSFSPQEGSQEVPQKEEPDKKSYISNELAIDWDFTTRMILAVAGRR